MLTALALAALLGAAALATDLAVIYGARRRAQAIADAAALAGGQLLPNTAQATAAARAVIAANSTGGGAFTATSLTSPTVVTQDDGTTVSVGTGDSLLVQGTVDAPLAFGPAVGYQPTSSNGKANTLSVPAEAATVLGNACGLPPGLGVAPFGLIGDDPTNADPTARYVATLLSTAANAQTPSPKTYQPVTSYGGQPLVLRQNVWSGGKLVFAGNFDPLQMSAGQTYQSSIYSLSAGALTAGQALSPVATATISLTQSGVGARLSPSNTAVHARLYDHAGLHQLVLRQSEPAGRHVAVVGHGPEHGPDLLLPVGPAPAGVDRRALIDRADCQPVHEEWDRAGDDFSVRGFFRGADLRQREQQRHRAGPVHRPEPADGQRRDVRGRRAIRLPPRLVR